MTREHLCRQWLAWLLLVAGYFLFRANYMLGFNLTPSLPQHVFLIRYQDTVSRGDYVVFRWHGGPPYPDGFKTTKRVVGVPGDVVSRHGRQFTVRGQVYYAKETGLTGRRLEPNPLPEGDGRIPHDKFFVVGDHEYSIDSRYLLVGLVDRRDIVGRAIPLF
jgi:conjugal transfer pilin signal peptidase TrbI